MTPAQQLQVDMVGLTLEERKVLATERFGRVMADALWRSGELGWCAETEGTKRCGFMDGHPGPCWFR